MNSQNKKVLFIFQHFGKEGNVGNFRANRYIEWFQQLGFSVTILNQSEVKNCERTQTGFGEIFSCNDPLFWFNDLLNSKRNRFFKFFLILFNIFLKNILIPDNGILWAKKVRRNLKKILNVEDFEYVISTSPLVSGHIINTFIKKQNNAIKSIIDLRDGWIDEPINTYLKFPLRKYYESQKERDVFNFADHIIVTSEKWKELLVSRYPEFGAKTTVLTNAYPDIDLDKIKKSEKNYKYLCKDEINLSYIGRLTQSRPENTIKSLFKPLIGLNKYKNKKIKLNFFGVLSRTELKYIDALKNEILFGVKYWGYLKKDEVFGIINESDILILHGMNRAFIPCKFFDYVFTGKPILAITPRNSMIWELSKNIPQLICIDSDSLNDCKINISNIIDSLIKNKLEYKVPKQFESAEIQKKFNGLFINGQKNKY